MRAAAAGALPGETGWQGWVHDLTGREQPPTFPMPSLRSCIALRLAAVVHLGPRRLRGDPQTRHQAVTHESRQPTREAAAPDAPGEHRLFRSQAL